MKYQLWLFIVFSMLSQSLKADTPLTIGVASNFQLPLKQLLAESPTWDTQNIRIVVGASGSLYNQVVKGAPLDVVLLANSEWPERLYNEGLASQVHSYAIGKLVVWPLGKANTRLINISKALNATQGKIAIAHPEQAPYGASAKAFINKLPINANIQANLVLARSVSQAFQFVDSGNAQIGFVAESLLIQAYKKLGKSKYLDYYLIPQEQYPKIVQKLALLNSVNNRSTKIQSQANDFIDFLLNEKTQEKLEKLGYSPLSLGPTRSAVSANELPGLSAHE